MPFEVYKPKGHGRRPAFDHDEGPRRFNAGESYREIADSLDLPLKTVRQALQRRGARVYGTGRQRG